MLFGMVSRKILLSSSKNKLQHIQLSYTTGASNETGFYGQMNLKKYPMCTMKYTAVVLMLWAYISVGGLGHLYTHGIMDSIKCQQIKKIDK